MPRFSVDDKMPFMEHLGELRTRIMRSLYFLLGGLLIGVASGITTVFLPQASEAVMYVLMALVLLVRPRGLLGEEGMMT